MASIKRKCISFERASLMRGLSINKNIEIMLKDFFKTKEKTDIKSATTC